jgi:hypothetical protein
MCHILLSVALLGDMIRNFDKLRDERRKELKRLDALNRKPTRTRTRALTRALTHALTRRRSRALTHTSTHAPTARLMHARPLHSAPPSR